jgi:hypothetical protein
MSQFQLNVASVEGKEVHYFENTNSEYVIKEMFDTKVYDVFDFNEEDVVLNI